MIEVLVCFYKRWLQSIVWFVIFALKNGVSGWAEAKKFGFFEKKNIYILSVGYLTCSAK